MWDKIKTPLLIIVGLLVLAGGAVFMLAPELLEGFLGNDPPPRPAGDPNLPPGGRPPLPINPQGEPTAPAEEGAGTADTADTGSLADTGGALPPPSLPPSPDGASPPPAEETEDALPPPSLPDPPKPQNPRRVVGPTVTSRGAPAPENRRIAVDLDNATSYIGQVVEVVTVERQRQRVILEGVEPDRLWFNAEGFHYSLPVDRVRELWIVNP